MSVLADVQDLYGRVQSTWAKSHAHVIAHAILVLLLFVVFRVTIPKVDIPTVSPAEISKNEWFKLAKDTGVVYVSFVIPFVILAIYAALLRTVGQWLITGLVVLFPAEADRSRFRFLNEWTLEPLALVLKKEDFDFDDLVNKAGAVSLKYESRKNEQWENYRTSLGDLTKNSTTYLGDFLFFLAAWITIFHTFPHLAWVRTNESRFWPVALVLLALAWFAWFRVHRALAVMPSLHLVFVSTMIRADPDMASFLESSDEHRNAVRLRLRSLLSTEQRKANRKPSLRRLVRYRLGYSEKRHERPDTKTLLGWPLCWLYHLGRKFPYGESDDELKLQLVDYLAYLYYRFWDRLRLLGKTVLAIARHALTGSP